LLEEFLVTCKDYVQMASGVSFQIKTDDGKGYKQFPKAVNTNSQLLQKFKTISREASVSISQPQLDIDFHSNSYIRLAIEESESLWEKMSNPIAEENSPPRAIIKSKVHRTFPTQPTPDDSISDGEPKRQSKPTCRSRLAPK
jgi:hypothetical protein